MNQIQIHDKSFQIFIHEDRILTRVNELAKAISKEFAQEQPLFIAVLNGSFIFAADLMKHMDFPCEIQFVKVSSYHGTQSSGKVQQVLGLSQPIKNRKVIIIEDIIDSGLTIDFLRKDLLLQEPSSISICSLLVKPDALKVKLDVQYTGFEVDNHFLVGYGLDYDGLGRNLRHLYQAID
ncbi:MAG: hypoxanthine phosphoribosyltransferase [Bacteroidetes bacterium B1(2017)]|nr:MAG: hypoxanthine phosphoribosyltransferase [Bacteroidetes bacterium B1(2017)]